MPKYIPRKEKKMRRKWKCPGCGIVFETVAKDNVVVFLHQGKRFGGYGGDFEKITVTCPKCKGFIVFTREELLGG